MYLFIQLFISGDWMDIRGVRHNWHDHMG